jgi:hypothetical protein
MHVPDAGGIYRPRPVINSEPVVCEGQKDMSCGASIGAGSDLPGRCRCACSG